MEIINPQRAHRLRRHSKHTADDNMSNICTANHAENTCCMYPYEVFISFHLLFL